MKTLVCTVGGSREPILAAIRHHKPDRVVFVCSEDDPQTERSGSYIEVATKNPSIPQVAGLGNDAWAHVLVPADDPAAAIEILRDVVRDAVVRGWCIADYTGGTKSMCAALFFVAAQVPEVELSLVTGPRSDLLQVTKLARVRRLANAGIHRARLLEQVAKCWQRFAYDEATHLLENVDGEVRDAELDRAADLSRAFAYWDAWDHNAALAILDVYPSFASELMARLRGLSSAESRASEALRVVDIYASAERREMAHQYDAAVLRLYRTYEWIAQWTLRWDHDIDTSNVSPDSPIVDLAHRAATDKLVLGCDAAWKSVARLDGPLSEVARSLGEGIRDLARKRNESLLTHGRTVLDRRDVTACRDLLTTAIWAQFKKVADVKEHQLPKHVPAAM